MIDIRGLPSLEIHRALALSLSVALRATLLMLAAVAVHAILGRGRPLVRSVIWNACLLGLLLLPISAAAFPRLRRASPAVLEPRWAEALGRWRGRLNVAGRVRLARSRCASVPVVVGWLRRGDYAWNVLLRLVQALYWPHPLVWVIGRSIAGVREQACDELCVAWLGGATSYCATLLEVTAGLLRRLRESLGLAMTRSTKLGRRLASLARSPGAPRCLLRAPARGAIVVAVLAVFGLLGSVTLVRPRADEPAVKDRANGRRVRVERVKRGEVRRATAQPGTVQAFESAEIFAKVSGYLKEQKADIGDRVKKGELLAMIDAPELVKAAEQANAAAQQAIDAIMQAPTRLRTAESEAKAAGAAVEQLEAEADRAAAGRRLREIELANTKKLRADKVLSQNEVDLKEEQFNSARAAEQSARAAVAGAKVDISSADSRVDQARADLVQAKDGVQLAKAALERARMMADATRIFSPYDGVVTLRGYHPGDFIRAADAGSSRPLFRVARTDKMRVVTFIPDCDVPYLERGNPATVAFDALPGQTYRGTVARFTEAEDPQTRTMRTEIDLDNSGRKLREGMFGIVTIVLNDHESGLSIPTTAIVPKVRFGHFSCFCIVDGCAELTPIQCGIGGATRTRVLDGLKEGDVVVVDPEADGVKAGQRVEVEER